MSGNANTGEQANVTPTVSLLIEELNLFSEGGESEDDVIPPTYLCMNVCDDLRSFGPAASAAAPHLLAIMERSATTEDEKWLRLRAAHAHAAITGEPDRCVEVAVGMLNEVSSEPFPDSPGGYDDSFWLRAWACDILAEVRPAARSAAPRLERLRDNDACEAVRCAAWKALVSISPRS